MDFFDFFCMLVDITDSPIADIAKTISYDRSYVSKWYNRKTLPSVEAWPELSPKLSAYFSERMKEEHYTEIAIKFPRVKTERNFVSAKGLLKSLLDDAFNTSILSFYSCDKMFAAPNISLILNSFEEFLPVMIDIIERGTTSEVVTKNIYFQWDILNALTPELIDGMRLPFTSNNNYRLHFIMSSEILSNYRNEATKVVHKFFRLVSQMPFLELIPYLSDDISDFQCFLDESFHAYGTAVPPGKDLKIFVTQHPYVFEKNRKRIEEFFSKAPQLVESETSAKRFLHWLNQSYSEKQGFLYLPSLPLHWASQELCKKMLAAKHVSQTDYYACKTFAGLSEKDKLQQAILLIPEAGLHRVLQDGIVKTFEGYVQLSDVDRSAYAETIHTLLAKKKDRGEVFIIPNHIANVDRLPSIVIYSDSKIAFYLQTNQTGTHNKGRFFNKVNDAALARIVHSYLAELRFIENNKFAL